MIDEKQKKQAQDLLNELNNLNPTQLKNWNIRAQTFLTFALIGELNESLRNNSVVSVPSVAEK